MIKSVESLFLCEVPMKTPSLFVLDYDRTLIFDGAKFVSLIEDIAPVSFAKQGLSLSRGGRLSMKLNPMFKNMFNTAAVTIVLILTSFLSTQPLVALADGGGLNIDFIAKPLQPSSVDPTVTSYFLDQGNPGDIISETLTVTNDNDHPIVVNTKTVEAANGINGGIVYSNESSNSTWITDLPAQISLASHATKQVSFHIRIPSRAPVGDHIFAIALQDQSPQTTGKTASSSQISVQMKEQVNRVISVFVKVPGPAVYDLNLDKASLLTMPSGAYLTIDGINNSSMLLTNLNGTITLYQENRQIWSTSVANVKLLPDKSFQFQYRWEKGSPPAGNYRVAVNLNGQGIGQIQKDLPLAITTDTLKNYQELTGNKAVQRYIPTWVYYAGSIGLIILLALALLLLRAYRILKQNQKN